MQDELSADSTRSMSDAERVGPSDPTPARPLACAIDLVFSDRVNFAMQQHGVALVDEVRLVAGGDRPIEDATLTLRLENEEAEPLTLRLARLEPGVPAVVRPEGFALSGRRLAQRTERERTAIEALVRAPGDGGGSDSEARASFAVELLPFDQWPGVGHAPELSAAFVTPNHPRIAELLGGARESLRKQGLPEALDGYQSGSRVRAAQIAEACFHALSAMDIGYINPPASFETAGQRVRLVDRVARERLGTCLDLSLVLMGMWEQCGLHPLLLLTEGHALPAVWTHEAHLPEVAIDEPARVRNLIALGEIVPVESTLVTQRGALFGQAVESGKKRMVGPGDYFCAIDVRSARKRGIGPLPLRVGDGDDAAAEVDLSAVATECGVSAAGSALDSVELAERAERRTTAGAHRGAGAIDQEIETANERITRWQRRLLDLSLRNRLLNFRESARTVDIVSTELAAIEDRLADGQRLVLLAKPDDPKALDDPAFVAQSLDARQLYLRETRAETDKRLLTLFRTAKSSIEETGANLLYLAMGVLKWYESPSSEQPRFAPLILLPITLHRAAAGAGYAYSITLSDEPLRANVTLLEKLRTEFGIDTAGLDDLPEDEAGLDVPMILRNFRAAIRGSARWEVIETARIGLFSFNKFLMWRDLQDNLKKLKDNRLVSHLVDRPGSDFDPSPFPSADRLDDEVPPGTMLCTRDADSSQLAAIRAAADGRSFVLEGPPGTGKSQTIANMIADALAHGRRVLFVAEKMAALSVVRKRLEDDGLGAFCLELHSAKASKKEVLAQLQRSLDAAGGGEPAEWAQLCSDLSRTREQLNGYVRAMHEPRVSGESLYRVLGRLCLLGDGPRVGGFGDEAAGTTAERLREWRSLVETMRARSRPVDPVHEHPLRGIGQSNWSFTLTDTVRGAIDGTIEALGRLSVAADAYAQDISAAALAPGLSRDAVKRLAAAASQLEQCPGVDARLLVGSDAAGLRDEVMALGKLGRKRDAIREQLLSRYREEFLELDHLPHIDAVRRVIGQPGFVRIFTAGGVKRGLRVYAKQTLPGWADVLADLERARECKRMSAEIAARADMAALLGQRWNGGNADWNAVDTVLAWCESFSATLAGLRADRSAAGLADALVSIAGDVQANERAKAAGRRLVESWNGWTRAWADACKTLETSNELAFEAGGGWLAQADTVLRRWRGGLGELNAWCTWRHARDAAVAAGLGELVTLYERGRCGREALDDIFERSYGHAWFNAMANAEPAVRGFNAEAHTDTIARFRRIDQRTIELARHIIKARLKAAAPAVPEQASSQSEIGILRRELRKRSRHMPTRKLIESMPSLLPRLKPCFLMSPLSVAQFLDAKLPAFDLVVFDEASQIPVWDAIGAIARGTEVIVVGDSKQLPPTNFFSIIGNEEEGEAEDIAVDDLESILEECNASGIPGLRLRWHYRSRHETLIAFSNHHYYNNELHTFPSPDERSERLGVSFVHVSDGVYDRGGSRTNRIEAQRVADRVVRMLRDPDDHDSIGIVTFNQAQQGLIEDLLDAKRREFPEIEPYFTSEVHEPVFVKNLENVQGDERDTIIFSVGYGIDQHGKASMNFGPLNKDGGERRLNVAVTRARRRLMVHASITSDQIDLNRTRATGVRHFKTFLDYAKRGPQAIAEAVLYTGDRDFDSPFERAVSEALVARGWQIDQQVGCAGYRIDLAVRHPEKPGRYVLGIECDGAAYHSARTARDRDRIRQSVLEGLGWRIARVWSTDWWVNPERCLERLDAAINAALLEPEQGVAIENKPVTPSTDDDATRDAMGDGSEAPFEPTNRPFASSAALTEPARSREVESSNSDGPEVYRLVKFSQAKRLLGVDLAEASADRHARRAIAELIEVEAPIVESLAIRRLAGAFGVSRLTERVREAIVAYLEACERDGVLSRVDGAFWMAGADPEAHAGFRVPNERDEETRRDIEDIPLVELANAVARTLREQFGMPREELVREVARRFGIQRATARVGERISEAIDLAIGRGHARGDDGGIVLPGD